MKSRFEGKLHPGGMLNKQLDMKGDSKERSRIKTCWDACQ